MDDARLPWIDEKQLAKSIPQLFHYTRATNLGSILKSGGLFATSYEHTNDAAELRALRAPFVDVVREAALRLVLECRDAGAFKVQMSDADAQSIVCTDAGTFHDTTIRALPSPPHITCFSFHDRPHHAESGLLSLWRFYGGDGEGVALGFDTAKLADLTEDILRSWALDFIYLDQVLYGIEDPTLQTRLKDASGLPLMYLDFLRHVIEDRVLEYEAKDRQHELRQLIVLACSAKHPDFTDEREVRLVLSSSLKGYERGRQRMTQIAGKHVLVPLLDALTHVIVGPSRDQERLTKQVRTELNDAGFAHIQMSVSKTPFRVVHAA